MAIADLLRFGVNAVLDQLNLRGTCNLSRNDAYMRQMTVEQWEKFVKTVTQDEAFTQQCKNNKKTMNLYYHSLRKTYTEV